MSQLDCLRPQEGLWSALFGSTIATDLLFSRQAEFEMPTSKSEATLLPTPRRPAPPQLMSSPAQAMCAPAAPVLSLKAGFKASPAKADKAETPVRESVHLSG